MITDPQLFQAKTLALALRLYARTGKQANSAYTPSAMIRTAARITGRMLPSRGYLQAAEALDAWAVARADDLADAARAVAEEQYWERLTHACDR